MQFKPLLLAAVSAAMFTGANAASTANVSFAAGAGFFDIFLENITTDLLNNAQAPQLMTGVSFTTVNGPADLTGSPVSYVSGDVISWTGGTKSDLPDVGVAWAWGPAVAGFPNYLNALAGSVGSSGPDYGIINTAVTHVKTPGSLSGASHNPMYQGIVQFHVINDAITADTRFTNVKALFNTVPPNPVPEPGTYALLMAGLGAVGFVARRRKAA